MQQRKLTLPISAVRNASSEALRREHAELEQRLMSGRLCDGIAPEHLREIMHHIPALADLAERRVVDGRSTSPRAGTDVRDGHTTMGDVKSFDEKCRDVEERIAVSRRAYEALDARLQAKMEEVKEDDGFGRRVIDERQYYVYKEYQDYLRKIGLRDDLPNFGFYAETNFDPIMRVLQQKADTFGADRRRMVRDVNGFHVFEDQDIQLDDDDDLPLDSPRWPVCGRMDRGMQTQGGPNDGCYVAEIGRLRAEVEALHDILRTNEQRLLKWDVFHQTVSERFAELAVETGRYAEVKKSEMGRLIEMTTTAMQQNQTLARRIELLSDPERHLKIMKECESWLMRSKKKHDGLRQTLRALEENMMGVHEMMEGQALVVEQRLDAVQRQTLEGKVRRMIDNTRCDVTEAVRVGYGEDSRCDAISVMQQLLDPAFAVAAVSCAEDAFRALDDVTTKQALAVCKVAESVGRYDQLRSPLIQSPFLVSDARAVLNEALTNFTQLAASRFKDAQRLLRSVQAGKAGTPTSPASPRRSKKKGKPSVVERPSALAAEFDASPLTPAPLRVQRGTMTTGTHDPPQFAPRERAAVPTGAARLTEGILRYVEELVVEAHAFAEHFDHVPPSRVQSVQQLTELVLALYKKAAVVEGGGDDAVVEVEGDHLLHEDDAFTRAGGATAAFNDMQERIEVGGTPRAVSRRRTHFQVTDKQLDETVRCVERVALRAVMASTRRSMRRVDSSRRVKRSRAAGSTATGSVAEAVARVGSRDSRKSSPAVEGSIGRGLLLSPDHTEVVPATETGSSFLAASPRSSAPASSEDDARRRSAAGRPPRARRSPSPDTDSSADSEANKLAEARRLEREARVARRNEERRTKAASREAEREAQAARQEDERRARAARRDEERARKAEQEARLAAVVASRRTTNAEPRHRPPPPVEAPRGPAYQTSEAPAAPSVPRPQTPDPLPPQAEADQEAAALLMASIPGAAMPPSVVAAAQNYDYGALGLGSDTHDAAAKRHRANAAGVFAGSVGTAHAPTRRPDPVSDISQQAGEAIKAGGGDARRAEAVAAAAEHYQSIGAASALAHLCAVLQLPPPPPQDAAVRVTVGGVIHRGARHICKAIVALVTHQPYDALPDGPMPGTESPHRAAGVRKHAQPEKAPRPIPHLKEDSVHATSLPPIRHADPRQQAVEALAMKRGSPQPTGPPAGAPTVAEVVRAVGRREVHRGPQMVSQIRAGAAASGPLPSVDMMGDGGVKVLRLKSTKAGVAKAGTPPPAAGPRLAPIGGTPSPSRRPKSDTSLGVDDALSLVPGAPLVAGRKINNLLL